MIKNFKIFESEDNYEVIATNHSSHHWEDDNFDSNAEILLDRDDDSLYLKITCTHTKLGIGAGTYPKQGEFVKIGTLQKADLALVRSLLSKHKYDQVKFSKFWEDKEGNRMSLTDLIQRLKPEKPKKEFKHIQPIETFDVPKIKIDIELVKYTDYSYALFGTGTISIKDKLKKIGCKYNKFLTDPNTGQKRPGWIVANKILDKVKELL
jgi:hypothetical protein